MRPSLFHKAQAYAFQHHAHAARHRAQAIHFSPRQRSGIHVRDQAGFFKDSSAHVPQVVGQVSMAEPRQFFPRLRVTEFGFFSQAEERFFATQPFTGFYCGNSQIIMIGTTAQPESLTHEFGHAFSLDHTGAVDYNGDGVNDFPATNIMVGGGFGRVTYSEGQGFRMSLNGSSDLNGLGYRTGSTRTCPDATINARCPWVALDATPN